MVNDALRNRHKLHFAYKEPCLWRPLAMVDPSCDKAVTAFGYGGPWLWQHLALVDQNVAYWHSGLG